MEIASSLQDDDTTAAAAAAADDDDDDDENDNDNDDDYSDIHLPTMHSIRIPFLPPLSHLF